MERKPEAMIENWRMVNGHLYGQFFGHPNQYNAPNGSWGWTTPIVNTDGATYAETKNTMYSLGKKCTEH